MRRDRKGAERSARNECGRPPICPPFQSQRIANYFFVAGEVAGARGVVGAGRVAAPPAGAPVPAGAEPPGRAAAPPAAGAVSGPAFLSYRSTMSFVMSTVFDAYRTNDCGLL